MSINTFMKITGAVAILFGIGFLLAPGFMAATYGVAGNDATNVVTRFLGLTSIGWGLVGWLVSESSDWTALRGAVIGIAVGDILGVIVSAWYTVNGALNAGSICPRLSSGVPMIRTFRSHLLSGSARFSQTPR
jgi:hypothetical protein